MTADRRGVKIDVPFGRSRCRRPSGKAMPRTWRGISSDGGVEPGTGDHLPRFFRCAAVEGPLEPGVGLKGGDLLWCVHEGIFSPADEGEEVFVAGRPEDVPPERPADGPDEDG